MILLQTDYGSHVSILHVVRKNKFTNYVTDDGEPHFLHVCCLFKHVPNRLRSGMRQALDNTVHAKSV